MGDMTRDFRRLNSSFGREDLERLDQLSRLVEHQSILSEGLSFVIPYDNTQFFSLSLACDGTKESLSRTNRADANLNLISDVITRFFSCLTHFERTSQLSLPSRDTCFFPWLLMAVVVTLLLVSRYTIERLSKKWNASKRYALFCRSGGNVSMQNSHTSNTSLSNKNKILTVLTVWGTFIS